MGFDELVTKADLYEMEKRIMSAISTAKKKKPLSFVEAREYLCNMASSTLYNKTASGEIPSHKIGKKLYYDVDDLDDYLSKNKRNSRVSDTLWTHVK